MKAIQPYSSFFRKGKYAANVTVSGFGRLQTEGAVKKRLSQNFLPPRFRDNCVTSLYSHFYPGRMDEESPSLGAVNGKWRLGKDPWS
jgi:hypothetical protein